MIDPQLENKVVLISGANHGIGAATAKAFAAQGSKVFITYYRDKPRYSEEELQRAKEAGTGSDVYYRALQQQSGDEIIDQIRTLGGVVTAHETDLGIPTNIPAPFDLCEAQFGPVDILVNNQTHCVLETFDPELTTVEGSEVQLISATGFEAHFSVNTRAYALMMSEYLQRYLRRAAKWGRIINLSTDAAHAHIANVSYAASKHGIESYSRSAALEMGKYGITVNIVAPGPIQTGYLAAEAEAEIAANTPLRRVGKPDDVADAILFLASEQARWITGQLICVGGGSRMHQ